MCRAGGRDRRKADVRPLIDRYERVCAPYEDNQLGIRQAWVKEHLTDEWRAAVIVAALPS